MDQNDALRAAAGTPLYVRVSREIAVRYLTGRSSRHQLLPSERDLAQQLGVSRVTLRKALAKLVGDGVVASSPGRGWYACDDVVGEPPNMLLSFTELGRQRGLHAASRVLSSGARPATIDEADLLEVAPGATLFHLERVRLLDDVPIAHEESRIPAIVAPGLGSIDFATVSLFQILEERFGVRVARASYAVEAIPADAATAELLGLEPGSPLLQAQQVTRDPSGRPIELARTRYRGDRYRFRATLSRPSGKPPERGAG